MLIVWKLKYNGKTVVLLVEEYIRQGSVGASKTAAVEVNVSITVGLCASVKCQWSALISYQMDNAKIWYNDTILTSSWSQFEDAANDHLPLSLVSATPELISAPATSQQDLAANEAQASASVTLDPSQPVTNIQIRLADGGRLVQRFNHTHRWLARMFSG